MIEQHDDLVEGSIEFWHSLQEEVFFLMYHGKQPIRDILSLTPVQRKYHIEMVRDKLMEEKRKK